MSRKAHGVGTTDDSVQKVVQEAMLGFSSLLTNLDIQRAPDEDDEALDATTDMQSVVPTDRVVSFCAESYTSALAYEVRSLFSRADTNVSEFTPEIMGMFESWPIASWPEDQSEWRPVVHMELSRSGTRCSMTSLANLEGDMMRFQLRNHDTNWTHMKDIGTEHFEELVKATGRGGEAGVQAAIDLLLARQLDIHTSRPGSVIYTRGASQMQMLPPVPEVVEPVWAPVHKRLVSEPEMEMDKAFPAVPVEQNIESPTPSRAHQLRAPEFAPGAARPGRNKRTNDVRAALNAAAQGLHLFEPPTAPNSPCPARMRPSSHQASWPATNSAPDRVAPSPSFMDNPAQDALLVAGDSNTTEALSRFMAENRRVADDNERLRQHVISLKHKLNEASEVSPMSRVSGNDTSLEEVKTETLGAVSDKGLIDFDVVMNCTVSKLYQALHKENRKLRRVHRRLSDENESLCEKNRRLKLQAKDAAGKAQVFLVTPVAPAVPKKSMYLEVENGTLKSVIKELEQVNLQLRRVNAALETLGSAPSSSGKDAGWQPETEPVTVNIRRAQEKPRRTKESCPDSSARLSDPARGGFDSAGGVRTRDEKEACGNNSSKQPAAADSIETRRTRNDVNAEKVVVREADWPLVDGPLRGLSLRMLEEELSVFGKTNKKQLSAQSAIDTMRGLERRPLSQASAGSCSNPLESPLRSKRGGMSRESPLASAGAASMTLHALHISS